MIPSLDPLMHLYPSKYNIHSLSSSSCENAPISSLNSSLHGAAYYQGLLPKKSSIAFYLIAF